MNKKSLILIFLLSISFISANNYNIDKITLNPGKIDSISDNYQVSIILNPSNYIISDNYQAQIGFLNSDDQLLESSIDGKRYKLGVYPYGFLCLFILLILIAISRKKQKVKT